MTLTLYTGTPIPLSWEVGAKRSLVIDLSMQAVSAWQPAISILANALIRPTNAVESANGLDNSTGYVYQNAASAGQTGALEPAWSTTGTIKDGSCTWSPVAPPAAGADTITSASWAATPNDGNFMLSGQTTTSLTATAEGQGTVAGSVYTVTASITMVSGLIYPAVFIITIT